MSKHNHFSSSFLLLVRALNSIRPGLNLSAKDLKKSLIKDLHGALKSGGKERQGRMQEVIPTMHEAERGAFLKRKEFMFDLV